MEKTSALEIELEHLRRKDAETEKLLSVTAHNLREPLRNVLSYTQLLHKEHAAGLDPAALHYLSQIELGGRRLVAILDGLSSMTSLDSRELRPRGVALKTAFDGAQRQLGNPEEWPIEFPVEPVPDIYADSEMVIDAIHRLLDNAIKFRRAGMPAAISVRAEQNGAEVEIAIADQGIGVGEPYREKCFGLFKRLHSQAEFPGEGIGLAFARKAIEKNGGRIWMEAHEGPGITVKLVLPAHSGAGD